MNNHHDKGLIHRIGCKVSAVVADVFAHPLAQIGIIVFCALWWMFKLPTDILTAALSILAITLTQMVLNNQNEREMDTHRRDVAMHTKLDELIGTSRRAKNEFIGIEEKEEEEIVHLKQEVKDAIEEHSQVTEPGERAEADRAVERARQELEEELDKRRGGKPAKKKHASPRG